MSCSKNQCCYGNRNQKFINSFNLLKSRYTTLRLCNGYFHFLFKTCTSRILRHLTLSEIHYFTRINPKCKALKRYGLIQIYQASSYAVMPYFTTFEEFNLSIILHLSPSYDSQNVYKVV
jgi:hypothetical protein